MLPGRGKASPGGKPLSIHRGKGERGGKQRLGGPYQRDCKGTSALGRGWPGDLGDSDFLECGAKFYCSITPNSRILFPRLWGISCLHPHPPTPRPGGKPLMSISRPSHAPPPYLLPLGATWRGCWKLHCYLFSGMISFFLETAPSLGWPDIQLEFLKFLCSCLSLDVSSLYPGTGFLHLGLLLCDMVRGTGEWLEMLSPGPLCPRSHLTDLSPISLPPSLPSSPSPFPKQAALLSSVGPSVCEPCSRHCREGFSQALLKPPLRREPGP